MSVIIQMEAKTWTQGFSTGTIYLNFTNSGTENLKNVKLKVVDSVVFTSVEHFYGSWYNCLNVFGDKLEFSGLTLPAGQTKSARIKATVKAGAPVQVHNLTCEFQYEVY